jgi:uncharacterized HAD superfamily protein
VRTLPRAIIVDIDGTLAHMVDRSPYDPSKYHTDIVDSVIRDIVHRYKTDGYSVVICSGRHDTYREVTAQWLSDNAILYDKLLMRKEKDNRNDSIVKEELFEEHIKPYYIVQFVMDDRNRVVDMWRKKGLKCLQVAPGDF